MIKRRINIKQNQNKLPTQTQRGDKGSGGGGGGGILSRDLGINYYQLLIDHFSWILNQQKMKKEMIFIIR